MAKPSIGQRPTSLRSTARSTQQGVLQLLVRALRRTRMLWMILLAFLFLSGCTAANFTIGI